MVLDLLRHVWGKVIKSCHTFLISVKQIQHKMQQLCTVHCPLVKQVVPVARLSLAGMTHWTPKIAGNIVKICLLMVQWSSEWFTIHWHFHTKKHLLHRTSFGSSDPSESSGPSGVQFFQTVFHGQSFWMPQDFITYFDNKVVVFLKFPPQWVRDLIIERWLQFEQQFIHIFKLPINSKEWKMRVVVTYLHGMENIRQKTDSQRTSLNLSPHPHISHNSE